MKAVVLILFIFNISDVLSAMTQANRDKILADHNQMRRDIGATAMIELTYDSKLEQVAQNYLETCGYTMNNFQHNPNRAKDYVKYGGSGSVGENWYSGGPTDATYAWCDKPWSGCSERDAFLGKCGGSDGHFTQVTWAASERVGCGNTPTLGTLCNYAPAGNFNNQQPYTVGTPCSACPSGTSCSNKLCSKGAPPAPKVDCVGSWSSFGSCVGTCGSSGTQTATYTITTDASGGGASCPNKNGDTKTQACTPACDCVGSWSQPGTCVGTCGSSGSQTLKYTITTQASNGGKACTNKDGETKSQTCTPSCDCIGSWSSFGPCSGTCGSAGTQTSTYTITTPASNGGTACSNKNGDIKSQACTPPCDCVGSWSSFGACVGTCGSSGTQTSTYTITTQAKNGGRPCSNNNGETKTQQCTPACADTNCVGEWKDVGTCSATCGYGTITQKFTITIPASGNGVACSNANDETRSQSCFLKQCSAPATDCSGVWQWKSCTVKCGGGISDGVYVIKKAASAGGADCQYKAGDLNPNPRPCNTNPCALLDISDEFISIGKKNNSSMWIPLSISLGCMAMVISLVAVYKFTKRRYVEIQELSEL